jgi:hypothetical protein
VHRAGLPNVEATITGMFGVTYAGGPAKHVPIAETRQIDDPGLAFLARPVPIRPGWDDLTIDSEPLRAICFEYLSAAQALMNEARRIAEDVHGVRPLTAPPS